MSKLHEGETLVEVLSGLGQHVGEFPYPTSALPLLSLCNGSSRGYYFAWNDTNNHKAIVHSPKLNPDPVTQEILGKLLWGDKCVSI